jgi:Cu(I)/Ag(I) efflux system membrane protein CusA/SilA
VNAVTVYDRSGLIEGAVHNLKITLLEETAAVSLVIILFLWHFPSAAIPIVTIPAVACIALIPMCLGGVGANVMSLSGIALAMGALVDGSIVVVEQTHKRLEEWRRGGMGEDVRNVVLRAIQDVARPGFLSLLVIALGFLPVFALEGQEGRLFRPLAYTKTFAMLAAALLAITLDPALRMLLIRGDQESKGPALLRRAWNRLLTGPRVSEERHPITGPMMRTYAPIVRWSLRHRWLAISIPVVLLLVTIPLLAGLGSEFMPPLEEGALLFMPTTAPGISIGEARRLMQAQDRVLASFAEVERVAGKAGRAETATDPAPLSMIETVITLKPYSEWPERRRWYSGWPGFLKPLFRPFWPDRASVDELVERMNRALQIPGVSNAWTMPVRNRTEMQNTGIRTAVGVKVSGPDIKELQRIADQVETALRRVRGTRSAFAERAANGFFVDISLRRDQLGRYGLSIADAEAAISAAIGGETVTEIVQGAERYPVTVRYVRGSRDNMAALERLEIPVRGNAGYARLGEVAEIRLNEGPEMVRDDNGLPVTYVYADIAGRDLSGYVDEARRQVARAVKLPPRYALLWSGEFESVERVRERLRLLLPATLAAITLLLFLNTRSWSKTALVLLAVPFSAIGAIWFVVLLGYHLSVPVWVGFIALAGIDAETGVFTLLYLDIACEARRARGELRGREDLREAIVEGAAMRIRPKAMTVAAMLAGLLPMLWSTGPGANIMSRVAAPMLGGIVSSFLLELLVFPALYEMLRAESR